MVSLPSAQLSPHTILLEDGSDFNIINMYQEQSSAIGELGICVDMVSDSVGRIWFASPNGIFYYDGHESNLIFQKFESANLFGMDKQIVAMVADANENICAVTSNGYLLCFNIFDQNVFCKKIPANVSFSHVTLVQDENTSALWICGGGIICIYDFLTDSFSSIILPENFEPNNLFADNLGNVWMSSSSGLGRIYRDTMEMQFYHHNPLVSNSLSNGVLICVYVDRGGVLWCGTRYGGINKAVISSGVNYFSSNIFGYGSKITALLNTNGQVWVGTDGGGLFFFNTENPSIFYHIDMIEDNTISSLSYDKENNTLWVGSYSNNAFYEYRLNSNEVIRYTLPSVIRNNITDIYYDSQRYVYLGTYYDGLWRYDTQTGEYLSYNQTSGTSVNVPVANIIETNLTIYFTAGDMIYCVSQNSDTNFELDMPTELRRGKVYSLYFDNQNIWIGKEEGLWCYDQDQRYTHINQITRTIYGIEQTLDMSNELYLQCPNGIIKYNKNDGTFHYYDLNFHLDKEAMHGTTILGSDGSLYFGGRDGFAHITPHLLRSNDDAPNVVVWQVAGDDFTISWPNQKFVLDYGNQSLEFYFAGLDYANPAANLYEYILEGFDSEPHQTTAAFPVAYYSNLPAGEYTLKIRACNNEDVWGAYTTIDFKINHPWWQTPWFIGALVAMMVIIIYLIVYVRTNSIQRQQAILEKQVNERTVALKEESEKRIYFTHALVHELKTPLTPMMVSSEVLAQSPDKQTRRYGTIIKKGADNLSRRIDELLDTAKGEVGMLQLQKSYVDLSKVIHESAEYMATQFSAGHKTFTYDVPDSLPKTNADTERINEIIVNLVGNAYKFTRSKGHVHLKAWSEGKNIYVSISDDGIGIPPEQQEEIFLPYQRLKDTDRRYGGMGLGLALSKMLIELHGGTITIKSEEDKGSVFTFNIPIKK